VTRLPHRAPAEHGERQVRLGIRRARGERAALERRAQRAAVERRAAGDADDVEESSASRPADATSDGTTAPARARSGPAHEERHAEDLSFSR
jgi:hypothetical protein